MASKRAQLLFWEWLFIPGVLAAACASYFVIFFSDDSGSNKRDTAVQQMGALRRAILHRQAHNGGEYLKSLDELVEPNDGKQPLIEGGWDALISPWGTPYQFEIVHETNGSDRIVIWTTDGKGQRVELPPSFP